MRVLILIFIIFTVSINIFSVGEKLMRKRNYAPAIRKIQKNLLQEYIDETVKPCNDFSKFSCGNWWKIESSGSSSSFNDLQVILEDTKLMINESLSDKEYFSKFQNDHPVVKARMYYESCMNFEVMTDRGWSPLLNFLTNHIKIPGLEDGDELKDTSLQYDWVKALAFLRLYGDESLIKLMVDKNFYNTNEYVMYFDQPERDVNLLNDDSCYYVYEIFDKLGVSENYANLMAEEVCEFEDKLQMLLKFDKDKPYRSALYRNISITEMNQLVKNLHLKRFIMLIRMKSFDVTEEIYVNLNYLQYLDKLISHTNSRTIVAYVITKFVQFTAKNFIRDEDDPFEGEENWWEKCVQATVNNMDMAIANIFVRKFLRSRKRIDIENIVMDIKRKFGEVLESITWVDSITREKAIEKFENMYIEIGFPKFILKRSELKKWFKGIEIDSDNFFETSMTLIKLKQRRELKIIKSENSKFDELYDVSVVSENAVYDLQANKITIAAGILQLPYYHHSYPRYMKYGVIGSIVAHELFHAFDNFGRIHNSNGNLEDWWTEISLQEYNKRVNCLIGQYNDLGAQGDFSLSENIADNGGLKVAYLAYVDWLNRNKNNISLMKQENIEDFNLTREQLFFVAFTQWRCDRITHESMVQNLNDPHPKEHVRITGTLSNSREFSKHFKCNLGDRLNPFNKCRL